MKIRARITVEVEISHHSLTIDKAEKELGALTDGIKRITLPFRVGSCLTHFNSIESKLLNREQHPEIPDK
jgi:hypothetical protein